MFFKRSRRYTHVTDEHLPIAPDVLGRELASPWRRAVAISVDACLCWFLVLPWMVAWGLVALFLQAPSMLPYSMSLFEQNLTDEELETLRDNAWPELFELVARRRPDMLSVGPGENGANSISFFVSHDVSGDVIIAASAESGANRYVKYHDEGREVLQGPPR